jgi:hypothetical protein
MLPESGDQLEAAADVALLAASENAGLGDVPGDEMGQAVLFEIVPDLFGGIESRRIRRESLVEQCAAFSRRQRGRLRTGKVGGLGGIS